MSPLPPPLPDIERLRWQCRRGMLELDYLLRDFLDCGYGELSDRRKRDFVRLLELADPVLYDWLMGGEAPEEPAMRDLIGLIRARASSGE